MKRWTEISPIWRLTTLVGLIALFSLGLSGMLDERWRESNHWFYVSFLLLWILLGVSLLWGYRRLYHPRKVSRWLSFILILFMVVPAMIITEHLLRMTSVAEVEAEGEILEVYYTEAAKSLGYDENNEVRVDLQVGHRVIENVLIGPEGFLSPEEEQLLQSGQKTFCIFQQGPLGEVLKEVRWIAKNEIAE